MSDKFLIIKITGDGPAKYINVDRQKLLENNEFLQYKFKVQKVKNKVAITDFDENLVQQITENLNIENLVIDSDEGIELYIELTGHGLHPFGGYRYWSNSCNVDSIIVLILESKSDFWRKHIFIDNVVTGEKIICSKDKEIDKSKFIPKFRETLFDDYKTIHIHRKTIKCESVREQMNQCLNLKSGKSYTTFYAENIYNFIMETLIPGSKMTMIKQRKSASPKVEERMYFYTNDYLLEQESPQGFLESYDISDNNEILAFSYNSFPYLRDLDTDNTETFTIEGQKISFEKKRVFGMEIAGPTRKFELIGVLMMQSKFEKLDTDPYFEGTSGDHYYIYLKSYDDKWYEYNDSTGIVKKINLEKTSPYFFARTDKEAPMMLFYRRI